MAAKTYRAVQVTKPGQLELVERELVAPPKGSVRIRVESCGVCHSDTVTFQALFPGITYPRVPGHEVAGVIDAVGSDVPQWKVGQRVGVAGMAATAATATIVAVANFSPAIRRR